VSRPLGLFQGFGIELEYMIVGRDDLEVRPLADELLRSKAGSYESEVENGPVAWSNELALHVVELKTNGPAPALCGLSERFQRDVREVNERLAPLGARLLPTAMHPWMDPHREFRVWPHEYQDVYRAFDRIFDCRGHGWANLQSVHLNLPFAGDDEFARLHSAIRLLLPLLPALAASSPFADGAPTGLLDTRIEVYRTNARRVPSVTGAVIPEPVRSEAEYRRDVLEPIYRDLAPLDPEGTLRHEWVNARGAIARFDRDTIEIRLMDVQECPRADVAVAAAATALLRSLVGEENGALAAQRSFDGRRLEALLRDAARDADLLQLDDAEYLALLGYRGPRPCAARDLWAHLVGRRSVELDGAEREALEVILTEGCLARRILERVGGRAGRGALRDVYAELAHHLQEGSPFRAART
jgi:glutamate---cysteine ligase / carboxylate-amine ligase